MDIATIAGIGLGFVLVFAPIILAGDIVLFIDFGSILIVVGGSIASTITSFSLKDFLGIGNVVKVALFGTDLDITSKVDTLIDLGEKARREGILALERELKGIEDEFMRKAIQLAVDGNEVEVIASVMGTEIEYLEQRHKKGKDIFDQLAMFAPAFGMLGTLVGLIQMLKNLDDPSNIGAGMALALVTTFYGSLLANVLYTPIANKLAIRSQDELLTKSLILEGILSIQSGDNPRVLRDKLETFIAPKYRKGSGNN